VFFRVLADSETTVEVLRADAIHLFFYGVFSLLFSKVVDRLLPLPVRLNIVEPG